MKFQSTVFLLTTILCYGVIVRAQSVPSPTTAQQRKEGYERRLAMSGQHMLQNLKFQSIGPTIMGGRVTDIDVSPSDHHAFYVAYASGGLWYTTNNGQSYKALFSRQMTMTIGDIAVNWNTGTIWVGTGEQNSSRSSYAGSGIYRSDDNGKTWKNLGLQDGHRIGRIVLHPADPNTLWVAVLGHLYSPNQERGVFKSTDGGKTWKKTLYVDDWTGAVDLVVDPEQPNTLYAAMWYRERKAWNFTESGSTSGIYKSTDGGETWKKVTGSDSGFPTGEGVGRIGLAFYPGNPKTVFALLDNQGRRKEEVEKKDELTALQLKKMSARAFLELNNKQLEDFLKSQNFPKKFTPDTLRLLVKKQVIQPAAIADYVLDANQQLFETEVIGAEVYRSDDGGTSWKKTHEGYLNDLVFSYGYYFGQIRVSKKDPKKIYIAGVPVLSSSDGGKTFSTINGDNQHVDHHALWVNPENSGHLINGNDGGLNVSYDDGKHWMKLNSPPVGQFYAVNVDNQKPYHVYGGLQDNGVWEGPSTYTEGTKWEMLGRYPYEHLLSGDGFKVEIDPRDPDIVYTGFQFGHYFRIDRKTHKFTNIQPHHDLGEKPLRFNWHTPIHLSRHNPDIIYFGSNKFHRSMDRGEHYNLVSQDLTKGGQEGDVAYGTLTCIHESPVRFGMIYVGTDDGNVWRTDDVGYHWKKINKGLPENLWVSSVQASAFDTNRVYVTLNGYRFDHFDAYLYVSENGGTDWKRIGQGLPVEPVNVVKEDPENKNLLYVGTDHGLYISPDCGKTFYCMTNGFPAVAVHDLVVQNREHDLVVGTHGRSIYKADIAPLQKLTDSVMNKGIHFFKPASITFREHWGKKQNEWKEIKPPKLDNVLFVQNEGKYKMTVRTKSGIQLYVKEDQFEKGLNYFEYHLEFAPEIKDDYCQWLEKESKNACDVKAADDGRWYLRPGKYIIEWQQVGGNLSASQPLNIKSPDKK